MEIENLISSAAVLVAELLFGIFCLGFALFLLRGVEQGTPRGILGPVFALAIIDWVGFSHAMRGGIQVQTAPQAVF